MLKQALKYVDKEMFQKFKDHQLSYDQLLSRVEEIKTGQSYVVLDDLKGRIQDDIIDVDKNDINVVKAQRLK